MDAACSVAPNDRGTVYLEGLGTQCGTAMEIQIKYSHKEKLKHSSEICDLHSVDGRLVLQKLNTYTSQTYSRG